MEGNDYMTGDEIFKGGRLFEWECGNWKAI